MPETGAIELPTPAGVDWAGQWEPIGDVGGRHFRCVFGRDRLITGTSIVVYAAAAQLSDGCIDTGLVEAPSVNTSVAGVDGLCLTISQARELAYALAHAVVDIEEWTRLAGESGCGNGL